MQQKFTLYREAGVREYWIIDPEHKTLHVNLLNNGTIFSKTYNASGSAPAEIFPDLSVDLGPVFAE